MDKALFFDFCGTAFQMNDLSDYRSDEIIGKLYSLTEIMLDVNKHMNLTRITEMNDVILKHYVDSLTVSEYIDNGSTVIDVGCGAGFPSLVLAIARPDLKITALDSTAKRINYINETARTLGLTNIVGIAARAEELAHDPSHREKYDFVCARAVARLNVLSELCMGFVKRGGYFNAMKAVCDEEINEAMTAIEKLGGTVASIDEFDILSPNPDENCPRCIVSVEKTSSTRDVYPRNYSQINKKPL